METKFNFNSQMCTTVTQSERLLALGLKKDTADMGSVRDLVQITSNGKREVIFTFTPDNWEANPNSIPRWSLHRLIELTRLKVTIFMYVVVIEHPQWRENFARSANAWDNLCDAIEWLIKEGYFNKEYLCEK